MMIRGSTDPALRQRLTAAREQARTPLSRDEVAEILSSVLGTLSGDLSALDLKLYNELESLARYIQAARQEIAAIHPEDISEEHIPRATDELDAVVGATEVATGTILDICEDISRIAGEVPPEASDALTAAVTRIYEACNFQDITGQRITKVVKTLKHIELKVEALLQAFGEEIERVRASKPSIVTETKVPTPDDDLMNGPQLPGRGIDQDEIDRLLASFD